MGGSEPSAAAELIADVARCRNCAAAGLVVRGNLVPITAHAPRVWLVDGPPSAADLEAREPFSDPRDAPLFNWLARAGFREADLRRDHALGNSVRCAAAQRGAPARRQAALCRALLERERELLPEATLVIPVGRPAIRAFAGAKPLNVLVGSVQRDAAGRWIVPLPHPRSARGWLARPGNPEHLARALRHLSRLRRRLGLAPAPGPGPRPGEAASDAAAPPRSADPDGALIDSRA